jgi:hypothetical protein
MQENSENSEWRVFFLFPSDTILVRLIAYLAIYHIVFHGEISFLSFFYYRLLQNCKIYSTIFMGKINYTAALIFQVYNSHCDIENEEI